MRRSFLQAIAARRRDRQSTVGCGRVRVGVTLVALASIGWLPAAGAQAVIKAPAVGPSQPQVGTPPLAPVTYATRSDGGREMSVQFEAPNEAISVQRAPDVVSVRLRSSTWFCEPADRTAAAGAFVNAVKAALEAFLAGSTPPPAPLREHAAPAAALEAFAQQAVPSQPRVLADLAALYTSPNQGPGELRRADCYTRAEMQAIKDEVDRIVRLRGG